MMYDAEARRRYKAQARADIRAQFWPTMLTVALETVPILLISMIYETGNTIGEDGTIQNVELFAGCLAIYLLAMVFIAAPLEFGAKHYFAALARGQEASPMLVAACFASGKKYVTSLKLTFGIFVYAFIWWLLLAAVTVLIVMFALLGQALLAALGALLIVPLALLVSVKIRRFDGAYLRMIDNPDGSVRKAIGACVPIFDGHNAELLVFDLSFFVWALFGVLTLGVVMIYVTAYQEIAFVHYFDALSGRTARGGEALPE